jgi:hypothetical protein
MREALEGLERSVQELKELLLFEKAARGQEAEKREAIGQAGPSI